MASFSRCDVCLNDYADGAELQLHKATLMHHTKLAQKTRECVHACEFCKTTFESLTGYSRHLNHKTHRVALKVFRKTHGITEVTCIGNVKQKQKQKERDQSSSTLSRNTSVDSSNVKQKQKQKQKERDRSSSTNSTSRNTSVDSAKSKEGSSKKNKKGKKKKGNLDTCQKNSNLNQNQGKGFLHPGKVKNKQSSEPKERNVDLEFERGRKKTKQFGIGRGMHAVNNPSPVNHDRSKSRDNSERGRHPNIPRLGSYLPPSRDGSQNRSLDTRDTDWQSDQGRQGNSFHMSKTSFSPSRKGQNYDGGNDQFTQPATNMGANNQQVPNDMYGHGPWHSDPNYTSFDNYHWSPRFPPRQQQPFYNNNWNRHPGPGVYQPWGRGRGGPGILGPPPPGPPPRPFRPHFTQQGPRGRGFQFNFQSNMDDTWQYDRDSPPARDDDASDKHEDIQQDTDVSTATNPDVKLKLSMKASQIIDDIMKGGTGKNVTVRDDTETDTSQRQDKGAKLLDKAENLCKELRLKRQFFHKERLRKESRQRSLERRKLSEKLALSESKAHFSDKYNRERSRSQDQRWQQDRSDAMNTSSSSTRGDGVLSDSSTRSKSTAPSVRGPNTARARRVSESSDRERHARRMSESSDKEKSDPQGKSDKDTLLKLVNSPRSRKERMEVARMLNKYSKALHQKQRPRLQMQQDAAGSVDQPNKDQALEMFNLEQLPDALRQEIAQLMDEEMLLGDMAVDNVAQAIAPSTGQENNSAMDLLDFIEQQIGGDTNTVPESDATQKVSLLEASSPYTTSSPMRLVSSLPYSTHSNLSSSDVYSGLTSSARSSDTQDNMRFRSSTIRSLSSLASDKQNSTLTVSDLDTFHLSGSPLNSSTDHTVPSFQRPSRKSPDVVIVDNTPEKAKYPDDDDCMLIDTPAPTRPSETPNGTSTHRSAFTYSEEPIQQPIVVEPECLDHIHVPICVEPDGSDHVSNDPTPLAIIPDSEFTGRASYPSPLIVLSDSPAKFVIPERDHNRELDLVPEKFVEMSMSMQEEEEEEECSRSMSKRRRVPSHTSNASPVSVEETKAAKRQRTSHGQGSMDQVLEISLREEDVHQKIVETEVAIAKLEDLLKKTQDQLDRRMGMKKQLQEEEAKLRSKRLAILKGAVDAQGGSSGSKDLPKSQITEGRQAQDTHSSADNSAIEVELAKEGDTLSKDGKEKELGESSNVQDKPKVDDGNTQEKSTVSSKSDEKDIQSAEKDITEHEAGTSKDKKEEEEEEQTEPDTTVTMACEMGQSDDTAREHFIAANKVPQPMSKSLPPPVSRTKSHSFCMADSVSRLEHPGGVSSSTATSDDVQMHYVGCVGGEAKDSNLLQELAKNFASLKHASYVFLEEEVLQSDSNTNDTPADSKEKSPEISVHSKASNSKPGKRVTRSSSPKPAKETASKEVAQSKRKRKSKKSRDQQKRGAAAKVDTASDSTLIEEQDTTITSSPSYARRKKKNTFEAKLVQEYLHAESSSDVEIDGLDEIPVKQPLAAKPKVHKQLSNTIDSTTPSNAQENTDIFEALIGGQAEMVVEPLLSQEDQDNLNSVVSSASQANDAADAVDETMISIATVSESRHEDEESNMDTVSMASTTVGILNDVLALEGRNYFEGHSDSVMCMRVWASCLVTGSLDGYVKKFEIQSQQCTGTMSTHEGVSCIHVTASGHQHRIFSGGKEGKLCVFDFKTCRLILQKKCASAITSLTEGNRTLYIGMANGNIIFYDLKSNKHINAFHFSDKEITCLAVGKEGSRSLLVAASADCSISIRDANSSLLMRVLEGHTKPPLVVQVVHNLVYSGGTDKTLQVHNINNGDTEWMLWLAAPVGCICVEGTILAVGCQDGTVTLYDTNSQSVVCNYLTEGRVGLTSLALKKSVLYMGDKQGTVQSVCLGSARLWKCRVNRCDQVYGLRGDLLQHVTLDHLRVMGSENVPCLWQDCHDTLKDKEQAEKHMYEHITKTATLVGAQ